MFDDPPEVADELDDVLIADGIGDPLLRDGPGDPLYRDPDSGDSAVVER